MSISRFLIFTDTTPKVKIVPSLIELLVPLLRVLPKGSDVRLNCGLSHKADATKNEKNQMKRLH